VTCHGAEAGTAPEIERKKNGFQKSQELSRRRRPSLMFASVNACTTRFILASSVSVDDYEAAMWRSPG
jgi:hypothetical protein